MYYTSKHFSGEIEVGDHVEVCHNEILFVAEISEIGPGDCITVQKIDGRKMPKSFGIIDGAQQQGYIHRNYDCTYITAIVKAANKAECKEPTMVNGKSFEDFLIGRDSFIPGQGNSGFEFL